jgi:hypothetical protein
MMEAAMDDRIARTRAKARHLWEAAGKPANRKVEDFLDEAGELVAIEDSQRGTLKPNPLKDQEERPFGEPVESPLTAGNLGEFPDLTDQGESKPYPNFENLENGSGKG